MNWWTRFLDFISPRQCVVCGERLSPTERSLCSVCVLHLPRTTYQFTPNDNPMAQLFWHLTPVERAAALLFYEPHSEMARIVYDMKYHDRPDIGEDTLFRRYRRLASRAVKSQAFATTRL